MSNLEKFSFLEFHRSSVVNSRPYFESDEASPFESIVRGVVAEHVSKIVPEETSDIVEDTKEQDNSSSNEDEVVSEKESVNLQEPPVNIKADLEAEYTRGFNDAKLEYEKQIKDLSSARSFESLLETKISAIVPEINVEDQIVKFSAEAISSIARKLHLILPVNFVDVITRGIIEKLNSFYKEGNITLIIHPNKYSFCLELLKLDLIPDKFKGKILVEQDESFSPDDCIVKWSDTKFEYSKEQLSLEIDKIINQLKVVA